MPTFPYKIIKYYFPTYIGLLNQKVWGEHPESTDGALESKSENRRDPEKAMTLIDYCYVQLKLDLIVDLCEICIICSSVMLPWKRRTLAYLSSKHGMHWTNKFQRDINWVPRATKYQRLGNTSCFWNQQKV